MKPVSFSILSFITMMLGISGAASAQFVAGSNELRNCAIPTRILFTNGIKRYVQYPGGNLTEMQPQPGYSTAKNWTMIPDYGPYQVQNCSNGGPGGTQWVAFRLKTANYFSSAIGSGAGAHLVFGLRFFVQATTSYDGIGMILMPQFGGMMGERFRVGIDSLSSQRQDPAPPTQIPLQDGVEYSVLIHANADYTSFSLTNVATGATTGFVGMPNPSGYPLVNNTGLLWAMLCSGGTLNCENWNSTPWSVDIWAIGSGWF